ncbi:MAG TPA: xanthine dehydrogenase family protein subunit M [Nitrososphaerales archaeon]|nr:xanthine dehydrogenase family protein subunit M [Nitrososphaerales archaeon]
MTPKKFDYYSASSIGEAIQLLHDKEDAKVLAGGQSLLALMKLRLAAPSALVDISNLSDLSYVREDKEYLGIGALTIHDILEHNQSIKKLFPILTDAASKIGDQQIRNKGTIGGSSCHADPAADLPTALAALDARFVIHSGKGQRIVPATEFFKDLFETAVGHDEVLSEIRLHYLPPNSASAYIKHSRREGDFAIVGTGVVLTVDSGNVCKDIRIAYGAVGPTPLRGRSVESYLKGKTLDDKNIADAAERANEGADPPSDMHGSKEYRLDMMKVFTRRTIKMAMTRLK